MLEAARASFAASGWNGTTVRGIAKQAGCSVETVYAVVGGKSEILKVLIDMAIVGDDEPVTLSERPEWQALGQGTLLEKMRAVALMALDQNRRLSGVYRTLDQAVDADPVLAALHAERMTTRRIQFREGARLVLGHDADEQTLLTLEVLTSHHAYDHAIRSHGLDETAYVDWLTRTLPTVLGLDPANDPATSKE